MGLRLGRLPWFIVATVVVVAMATFGVAGNALVGVYFERTTLTEANPFARLSVAEALEARVGALPGAASTIQAGTPASVEEAASSSAATVQPSATASAPSPSIVAPALATAVPASSAAATSPPATPVPSAIPTTAPTSAATSGAVLLLHGTFRDGAPGHHGSGTAQIGRDAAGKLVLVVEGFSVTNGPDLHVILSVSASGGGDGLDLGKLKATDGTFSYSIADGTDIGQYKSVTIWCKSFPTVFAYATLGN